MFPKKILVEKRHPLTYQMLFFLITGHLFFGHSFKWYFRS
ncbi:hypothetical protein QH294_2623 [Enterococcus faecalis]|nr:hypothetical protein QH294_2623 [Enterococcus faecalis]